MKIATTMSMVVVELEDGVFVTVRCINGDRWSIAPCGDGYEVYDSNGNTINYNYDKNAVINFAKKNFLTSVSAETDASKEGTL